jgi:hypothetical protein
MLSRYQRNQGKNKYFHNGGNFAAAVVNTHLNNGTLRKLTSSHWIISILRKGVFPLYGSKLFSDSSALPLIP